MKSCKKRIALAMFVLASSFTGATVFGRETVVPFVLPTVAETHGNTRENLFKAYLPATPSVQGNSYYVDCSMPNLNGSGTATNPLTRLSAVSAIKFAPGDSLKFRQGVTCHGQLILNGSGNLENPITLSSYKHYASDTGRPIINGRSCKPSGTNEDCTGDLYGFDAAGAAVVIKNSSYWTVRDIEVTNTHSAPVKKDSWIAGSDYLNISSTGPSEISAFENWRNGIATVEEKLKTDPDIQSTYFWRLDKAFEVRNGILVLAESNNKNNSIKGISIENVYVHDINGGAAFSANPSIATNVASMTSENKTKQSNGIYLLVRGTENPTTISDVTIKNSIIERVTRTGLATWTDFNCRADYGCSSTNSPGYLPFEQIYFYNNKLRWIWGDGVILRAVRYGRVERNAADRTALMNANVAGLWLIHSEYSTFAKNAVQYTGKRPANFDGQAYDIDFSNNNITFEKNYSYKNEGGFLLLCGGCTPGRISTNAVVRNNISVDDATSRFARALIQNNGTGTKKTLTPALADNDNVYLHDGTRIYNNTFIRRTDKEHLIIDSWETGVLDFRNNLIVSTATSTLYAPWSNKPYGNADTNRKIYDNYPASYSAPAKISSTESQCKSWISKAWTNFGRLGVSDSKFYNQQLEAADLSSVNFNSQRVFLSGVNLYFSNNLFTDGVQPICNLEHHHVLSGRKINSDGAGIKVDGKYQVASLNMSNSVKSSMVVQDLYQKAPTVYEFQGSGPDVDTSTLKGFQLHSSSPAIGQGSWVMPREAQASSDFFGMNRQPNTEMRKCKVDIGAHQFTPIPLGSSCQ